ncbi:MAG TPA: hypothetical protein VN724_16540 [Pyrinomonadaceae bacterium]|nr:hypothetical protein [Pyrinomonadaceae bacterium]
MDENEDKIVTTSQARDQVEKVNRDNSGARITDVPPEEEARTQQSPAQEADDSGWLSL